MGAMDSAVRRRTARLVALTAAAVVALAVLVSVARREPPAPPPAAAPTPTASASVSPSPSPVESSPTGAPRIPRAPAPPTELAALLVPGERIQVPVAQDGVPFEAEALAEDGTLLGDAGFDSEPYRAEPRPGLVQRGSPAVRWLGPARPTYAYGAGTGLVAWTEHVDEQHDLQVICARGPENWRPVQLSAGGVRMTDPMIHVDGGSVAWTDEAGFAWHSVDCGPPRRLRTGDVVALSGSDVFVRAGGQVDRYDLESGRSRPTSIAFGGPARFAASQAYVVWAHEGRLTVYDRGTGQIRRLEDELPVAFGVNGEIVTLTVGRRLLAYASRPMDGDLSVARSVVVDLAGNARIELGAEAFAAGGLLAWREGDGYTIARSR
jgi:hypothetical protein